MPWIEILLLIAGTYVLVKTVQGLRDLAAWYAENRAFAREQKKLKTWHRQGKPPSASIPLLKERPGTKKGVPPGPPKKPPGPP